MSCTTVSVSPRTAAGCRSILSPTSPTVAAYHEVQLADLVARVGSDIDRYRAGELNAFDVDQVIFLGSRAAKELWKFCNLADVELTAALVRERPPTDWWERAIPKSR